VIDRIQFLLGEGFLALRRNGWMTFAAVTTVAVSLFLIGGLGYLYFALKDESKVISGKFELRVMLEDGTKVAEISRAAGMIRKIDGVKEVAWIPRDLAWKKWMAEHPEHRAFVEIENPLPDSFKVVLTDISKSDDVISQIRKISHVEPDEIQYLRDEQEFYRNAQAVISWLGTVLGGILFITGGVLIYNAIRLTVVSRRLEIRIMQLVGASFLTVRIPFYIEGFIQGSLGGIIAAVIINAAHSVLSTYMRNQFNVILQPVPMVTMLAALTLLGAVYGLLCSMLAVRTPLRYR
jgi:cell division transport system permease protein